MILNSNTIASKRSPSRESRRRFGNTGFTLVEILIVVVILGILASIVVPQFSSASQQSRENVLKDELRYLRTQITVYAAQHQGASPGYPGGNPAATATEIDTVAQLINFSDSSGNTNATGSGTYRFGPYLSKFPANPVNGLDTILVVAGSGPLPHPDGATGWIYRPKTQEIEPNINGMDSNNVTFATY